MNINTQKHIYSHQSQIESTRISEDGNIFRPVYTKRQLEILIRWGHNDGTYKDRFEDVDYTDGFNVYMGLLDHLRECVESTESEEVPGVS